VKVTVYNSDKERVGEKNDVIIIIVICDVIGAAGESIRLNHFGVRGVQEF